MSSVNTSGFILSIIGAVLMSAETFEFLLGNTHEQAEEDFGRKYARFAPNDDQRQEEISGIERKFRIRKIIQSIGFVFLVVGFSLQLLD